MKNSSDGVSVEIFSRASEFLWRIFLYASAWEVYTQTLTFHEQRQEGAWETLLPKCLVSRLALGSPSPMPVVAWVWSFWGSSSPKNTFLPTWKGWSRDGLLGPVSRAGAWWGKRHGHTAHADFHQHLFSGPMQSPQLWRNLQRPCAQPLQVRWVHLLLASL